MLRSGVLVSCLLLASCGSVRQDVARHFVKTVDLQVATPADVGIAAEEVSIAVAGGSLHGYFLPAADAQGRTVVICHGNHLNVSMLHPWYSFLHRAGFNVVVFDPRGFGKSDGPPSVWAWLLDMREVMHWVRRRPEVEPSRIVLYGMDMGAVAAVHAATRYGSVAGVIAESLLSPRDHIRAPHGEGLGAAVHTGFMEFGGLPEHTEPDENAAILRTPLMVIAGAEEPLIDRRAQLRTFRAAKGPKTLWMLPGTAAAPHGLMTHDGEYQESVSAFVRSLFEGVPARVEAEWTRTDGTSGVWLDATLQRTDGGDSEPWAVEVCVADVDAVLSFHQVWLEDRRGSYRIKVTGEPGVMAAFRYHRVLGDESGSGWVMRRGELARAGQIWSRLEEDIGLLVDGAPTLADARRIAGRILTTEQEAPFPEVLEAHLAAAYSRLGRELTSSRDAEDRARGLDWLRRAIAAEPERPALYFWPGATSTFGFPHGKAVQEARSLLQRLAGG